MADRQCRAPSENADVTGIVCELPYGHTRDHCAWPPMTWPQEDDEAAAGAWQPGSYDDRTTGHG